MTVIRMNSCNSRTTVRVDTHRVIAFKGCEGSCHQGRSACDCELSNTIPLREELPRVNYRSSNWTGRFSRTLNSAFGCNPADPVYPMREQSSWQRFMAWLTGMNK